MSSYLRTGMRIAKGAARHALNARHYPAMRTWLLSGREAARSLTGEALRSSALDFTSSMKCPVGEPFQYVYSASQREPVLYASVYAVLIRHLYSDLPPPGDGECMEWAEHIAGFQSDDGLYRDPAIACELAERIDHWGWRHLTLHVLMALRALGSLPKRPLVFTKPQQTPDGMVRWLESRAWDINPVCVSNEVQNLATFLQFERDFLGNACAGRAVACMFEWLLERQNPRSGAWGAFTPTALTPFYRSWSDAAHVGYHIWLPMAYDDVPVPHANRILSCLLRTQNLLGGFGLKPNSTACDDIDSADPLVRLLPLFSAEEERIRKSLARALAFILANRNDDGGFVFLRNVPYAYYHPLMASHRDQSAMFPTWFRSLTLAFLSQCLDIPVLDLPWQFIDGPGHQFMKSFR